MNEKWRFLILLSEFNNRMKIRRAAKLELARSSSDQRNLVNFSHFALRSIGGRDFKVKRRARTRRRERVKNHNLNCIPTKVVRANTTKFNKVFFVLNSFFLVRFRFSRCVKNKLKMLKDKKKWLKVFAFFFSLSCCLDVVSFFRCAL